VVEGLLQKEKTRYRGGIDEKESKGEGCLEREVDPSKKREK